MVSSITLNDKELFEKKLRKRKYIAAKKGTYYRENPHKFVKEYLNINLKVFQKLLLWKMNHSTHFMYVAARSQGKSFLLAIFAVVRAILYPNTIVCVCSKTRRQGLEILEKITKILMPISENLRAEIKDVTINTQKAEILFFNKSTIKVVTANDNARGGRANVLIIDEFRMVDKFILDTVLRKFNGTPRMTGYQNKEKYKHMHEDNIEIYATSAWFCSHWSYTKLLSYLKNMLDTGKDYFLCCLPYQLSVKEGLLLRKQIEEEMSESDFSQMAFDMEMGCKWFNDSNTGLYSYGEIAKNRDIKYAQYPPDTIMGISDKRLCIQKKQPGEVRLLSADIALMSSEKRDNDASSIFINSMIPMKSSRYMNNIIYTENREGMLTDELALLIRKYFEQYECDYLVIDTKGYGFGVVDTLLKDIYDPQTGITYEGLSCFNNPEIANRCQIPNARKAIWAIQGNPQFNSECALGLREIFRQNRLKLLLSEFDCEDYLSGIKGYKNLTVEQKINLKLPYIHTDLTINELVNLNYVAKDNVIKVYERSGMRKDRYSSLSYNIYVSRILEADLIKPKVDINVNINFKQPKTTKLRIGGGMYGGRY